MTCRMADMRNKEVINVRDGVRLGNVCDIELDIQNANVCAIIIYGRPRLFGLMGREDDVVIRWDEIQVIGDETVLVDCNVRRRVEPKPPFLRFLSGGWSGVPLRFGEGGGAGQRMAYAQAVELETLLNDLPGDVES